MIMKIKKAVVYLLVTIMVFGTMNVVSAVSHYDDNFDGDIVENPWAELFTDANKSDVSIGGTTNTTETTTGPQKNKEKNSASFLQKTKVLSAKKTGKKARKAKISLKRIKGATGYQVKYSTGKKFKKKNTITKKFSKPKFTIKKLKRGKSYYVKARAYRKTAGRTDYGKWSAVKKITVKNKK